jgi:hypothetical protein
MLQLTISQIVSNQVNRGTPDVIAQLFPVT